MTTTTTRRRRRRHIDDDTSTDGRTMSMTDASDVDDGDGRRRRRVSAPERASEALRGVSLFAELSDADREALCGRLVEVTYGDGEAIVTRGEVGTRFYVVAVGRVRVVGFDDDDDGGGGGDGDEEGRDAGTKKTKTLYPGETFGEVALVRRCLRTATVIAAAPVVKLWALDRATFHETLKKTTFERRCEYTDYLNLVPLFRETLDARTRSMLVDALRMATFESGSIIVSPEDAYDEEGSKFYVILRGEAVVRMDDGELTEVNRLQRGDYFGEVSLIHKTSPTATVVAIGEMTTLTLDAESFHRMIGQDTISAMAKKLESYAYASNKVERKPRRRLHRVGSLLALRGAVTSRFRWLSFERKQRNTRKRGSPESLRNNRNCVKSVTPSLIEVNSRQDVTLLKEVGGGMLGAVFLAKTLNTHTVCCVKIMHKWKILHLEQRSNVCRELQLMKTFDSPFLTRAMGSFQDAHTLFLLMEYLPGGDLFQLLVSGPFKGGKFPVDVARFYAAEVLSALEYIHANEHLYRDLKPENVLIDGSGHIKLTDFGFCRRLAQGERAYTTCGTADYMAPEVMLAQGYNQSADYWSFGVLLYEMLAGYAPFASVSDGIRHRRIITSDLKFHTPYFDATAKSLISRLCIVDVSKRLGSSARGVLDLKTHDFFTEDWDVVTARRLEPPHVPTRKDAQAPHEGSVTRHRSREFYRSLDRRGERERMDAGARPLTAEASASFYGF